MGIFRSGIYVRSFVLAFHKEQIQLWLFMKDLTVDDNFPTWFGFCLLSMINQQEMWNCETEEQPVGAEHFAYLKLFLSSNQPNSIENLKRNLMTLLPLLLLTLHETCFLIVCYSIFSMAPTFPPQKYIIPSSPELVYCDKQSAPSASRPNWFGWCTA